MLDEIAAQLPEWTIRKSVHSDKDISYNLYRNGYKAFRLTELFYKGHIIAAAPPLSDDLFEIYPDKESALAAVKQIAISRAPIPEYDVLELESPQESTPTISTIKKLTMMFGRNNEKLIAASKGRHKSGYVYRFPETDEMSRPYHPSKHADIMASYLKLGEIICCIVTHSEIMMLYVLKEIAEKRLKSEQVEVIFVDDDGKEIILRLDDAGDFIDRWPHGFFQERSELLFY